MDSLYRSFMTYADAFDAVIASPDAMFSKLAAPKLYVELEENPETQTDFLLPNISSRCELATWPEGPRRNALAAAAAALATLAPAGARAAEGAAAAAAAAATVAAGAPSEGGGVAAAGGGGGEEAEEGRAAVMAAADLALGYARALGFSDAGHQSYTASADFPGHQQHNSIQLSKASLPCRLLLSQLLQVLLGPCRRWLLPAAPPRGAPAALPAALAAALRAVASRPPPAPAAPAPAPAPAPHPARPPLAALTLGRRLVAPASPPPPAGEAAGGAAAAAAGASRKRPRPGEGRTGEPGGEGGGQDGGPPAAAAAAAAAAKGGGGGGGKEGGVEGGAPPLTPGLGAELGARARALAALPARPSAQEAEAWAAAAAPALITAATSGGPACVAAAARLLLLAPPPGAGAAGAAAAAGGEGGGPAGGRDAALAALCGAFVTEGLSHPNAVAFLQVAVAGRVSALAAPAPRPLAALLGALAAARPEAAVEGVLGPVLSGNNPGPGSAQVEACSRALKALPLGALGPLLARLAAPGGGGGGGGGMALTDLTAPFAAAALGRRPPLAPAEAAALVAWLDAAIISGSGTAQQHKASLRKSVKVGTLIHSLVTKYGPQMKDHLLVLEEILSKCDNFMVKSAQSALKKLK